MSNRQFIVTTFLRLHKTFTTDRGRPYTDISCVIPPGVLRYICPLLIYVCDIANCNVHRAICAFELHQIQVPLLNALDCWMSYCIMILVAASALYLEPINKEGLESAAAGFWGQICGCDARIEVAVSCDVSYMTWIDLVYLYIQLSVTTSDVEHDIAQIVG